MAGWVKHLNKIGRQTSARKAARPKRIPTVTWGDGKALPAETRTSARPTAAT